MRKSLILTVLIVVHRYAPPHSLCNTFHTIDMALMFHEPPHKELAYCPHEKRDIEQEDKSPKDMLRWGVRKIRFLDATIFDAIALLVYKKQTRPCERKRCEHCKNIYVV